MVSYQNKPPPGGFPHNDMVFMCALAGGVIHSKPAVPVSKFGLLLERCLVECRTKESWEMLLTSLAKLECASETNLEDLTDRLDIRDHKYSQGVTPLKKQPWWTLIPQV